MITKKKYFLLFTFYSLLFFATQTYAFEIEGYPFVLEAEAVEFDNNTGNLNATGNVRMSQNDYFLSSDLFTYTKNNRMLQYKGNVLIRNNNREIRAQEFTYYFETNSGEAIDLRANVDKFYVRSKKLKLTPKKSSLHQPAFSTCDRDETHYEIKSETIDFYPETGDIVAQNNFLYFYNTPFFYFPTFIHNSRIQTDSPSSSAPDFGYNRVDGNYIKLNMAYFFSPFSNGTVVLGTTSLRGSLIGVHHRFAFNADQRLILKAFTVNNTGFEGGAVYEQDLYKIPKKLEENALFEKLFYSFTDDSGQPHGLLTMKYLQNEVENYTFVNYKPLVGFNFKNIELINEIKLSTDISHSYIEDEIAETNRYQGIANISRTFALQKNLDFSTEGIYLGNYYGTKDKWERVFAKANLKYLSDIIEPEISFTKKILNKGVSPFLFDTINTVETDELGLKITAKEFLNTLFIIEADYNLEEQKMRDLIYTIGLKQHCWVLMLSVNTVWDEVRLGFSLLSK